MCSEPLKNVVFKKTILQGGGNFDYNMETQSNVLGTTKKKNVVFFFIDENMRIAEVMLVWTATPTRITCLCVYSVTHFLVLQISVTAFLNKKFFINLCN